MRVFSSMLTAMAAIAAVFLTANLPALAQSESDAHRPDHDRQFDQTQQAGAEPAIDSNEPPAAPSGGQMSDPAPTRSSQGEGPTDQTQKQLELVIEGDKLIGKEVVGADHKTLGEIKDVIVGEDGQLQAVVTEIGSFLGMGGRLVALPVNRMQIDGAKVIADITRAQAEKLPDYKSRNHK